MAISSMVSSSKGFDRWSKPELPIEDCTVSSAFGVEGASLKSMTVKTYVSEQ